MVCGGLVVVWGGLGLAWQVNVIKMFLQLLILSQKHILGVKKVVWGCFHGP